MHSPGCELGALSYTLISPSTFSGLLGFPGGSAGKESACNAGDLGSIPGLARSPGEGKGYTPQNSGLENSMGCRVHGVTELDTTERLSLSLPCYDFLPLLVC